MDKTTERRTGMSKLPKAVQKWLSEIGTKGGKVTSPAKTEAVRKNGLLGGRPRKNGKKKG